MKKVAERLGLKSVRAVQRIFSERGWTPPSSGTPKKHIDPEVLHRLYFEEGFTLREIAQKLGMHPQTVSSRFREQGGKTRRRAAIERCIDVERVRLLYFYKGLTKEEVAQKLGVTEWAIRKVFGEMGWTSRIRQFDTEEEREQARKERVRRRFRAVKALRENLFGNECRICGAKRKLAIHKKDGQEHEGNLLWKPEQLKSLNANNWVALCIPCHRGVHWAMKYCGYDWEEIQSFAMRAESAAPKLLEPLQLPDDDAPSSMKYLKLKDKFSGNKKELRRAIFGEECYFCGVHFEEKTLVTHRKDGRPHDPKLIAYEKYFRTLDLDDWVSLCQKHHRQVTWASQNLGLEWKEIDTDRTNNT